MAEYRPTVIAVMIGYFSATAEPLVFIRLSTVTL